MKRRAIAIALRRHTPLPALLDFMYGTPERTRLTFTFAFGLLALAYCFHVASANAASMACFA